MPVSSPLVTAGSGSWPHVVIAMAPHASSLAVVGGCDRRDCGDQSRRRLRLAHHHHLLGRAPILISAAMVDESTWPRRRLPPPPPQHPSPTVTRASVLQLERVAALKQGDRTLTSRSLEERTLTRSSGAAAGDWLVHPPPPPINPPPPPSLGKVLPSPSPIVIPHRDHHYDVPHIGKRSHSGERKQLMCQGGRGSGSPPLPPSMIALKASSSPLTILSKAAGLTSTVSPSSLGQPHHFHQTTTAGLLSTAIDDRTVCARVQRLLIQFVLLPVVWMSLCCVITAAMGIECVETIQKALAAAATTGPRPTPSDVSGRPAKRIKRELKKPTENGNRRLDGFHPRDLEDDDQHQDGDDQQRHTKKNKTTTTANKKQEENASSERHQLRSSALVVANTTRKSRPRKRRVIIWDLDETLVLFASLYSGQFARAHGKDLPSSVALGEQMMTYLLAVLERHFYFSDLHDADIDHIASLPTSTTTPAAVTGSNTSGSSTTSPSDHQQTPIQKDSPLYSHVVADRYRQIRAIYERHARVDFLDDHSSQWAAARHGLVASIDMLSGGWLHEAREILSLTTAASAAASASRKRRQEEDVGQEEEQEEDEEVINVMVTNTQLSPALCKCLIYGLDRFFPIDCIYSSAKLHKMRCFQTIMAKYSASTSSTTQDVEFIAIGDGAEEEQVSHALGMSFFKIQSLDDLKQLRVELQLADKPRSPSPPQQQQQPPLGSQEEDKQPKKHQPPPPAAVGRYPSPRAATAAAGHQ